MNSKTTSRDPGLLQAGECRVVEDPESAMPAEYYANDMYNRKAENKACKAKFERLEETQ